MTPALTRSADFARLVIALDRGSSSVERSVMDPAYPRTGSVPPAILVSAEKPVGQPLMMQPPDRRYVLPQAPLPAEGVSVS